MLKKGQSVKFTRPMSSMRLVLMSVENGNCSVRSIMDDTRLTRGQVMGAIANLAYIGALCTKQKDPQGRAIYTLPGQIHGVPPCLKAVNSVFNPLITNP